MRIMTRATRTRITTTPIETTTGTAGDDDDDDEGLVASVPRLLFVPGFVSVGLVFGDPLVPVR